jgi:hypothetical protein
VNCRNFGKENQPTFIGLKEYVRMALVLLRGSVWNIRGENKIKEYPKI